MTQASIIITHCTLWNTFPGSTKLAGGPHAARGPRVEDPWPRPNELKFCMLLFWKSRICSIKNLPILTVEIFKIQQSSVLASFKFCKLKFHSIRCCCWVLRRSLTSQIISVAFYIESEKSDKFCSEAPISAWGSFTWRKFTIRDQRLYFPSEGSHTQDFYALKKSIDPGRAWTREPRIQWRVWWPLNHRSGGRSQRNRRSYTSSSLLDPSNVLIWTA